MPSPYLQFYCLHNLLRSLSQRERENLIGLTYALTLLFNLLVLQSFSSLSQRERDNRVRVLFIPHKLLNSL